MKKFIIILLLSLFVLSAHPHHELKDEIKELELRIAILEKQNAEKEEVIKKLEKQIIITKELVKEIFKFWIKNGSKN